MRCFSDPFPELTVADKLDLLQVRNKYGTTDIGLAADTASYGFFRQCGFDLDREESTFMSLQSSDGCKTDSCAAVKSRPSLIALLDQVASS